MKTLLPLACSSSEMSFRPPDLDLHELHPGSPRVLDLVGISGVEKRPLAGFVEFELHATDPRSSASGGRLEDGNCSGMTMLWRRLAWGEREPVGAEPSVGQLGLA